ncbi:MULTISPECIES: hypothetical protein [unclassified Paenibacillus]|uniref:hypothetical protein n=1 Tax=Paenibacillus TaxID=44249 RepID=UPI00038FE8F0|nr:MULTISPECIES: hypothetical protein [unclassified Paenibacillus]KKC46397.1 hypothetical protein VE23_03585 [Paenibacillus sp. D9]CDN43118.1 hypothetical protein BN871_CL_00290 [Paenibacillus sp. P22]
MKAGYILMAALGAALILFGLLPVAYAYPSSSGPDSGPRTRWELMLIISYENGTASVVIGILLLLLAASMLFFLNNKTAAA